jgi:hypothetical protein
MPDWDGVNYNIVANRYQQMFIQGYLDVSGRTIVRNGDVSFNEGNLYVGANIRTNRSLVVGYDSSMNGNLVVGKNVTTNGNLLVKYDSSFNGNLVVGNDLTITGRLNVKNFTNQNIINTTTNNYQLIVSEDLSLNGRMFVKGNVMIGSGNEPSYLLDVSSAASTQPFRVGVGATNSIVVNSSGNVGIGTTAPAVALDVNGSANFSGSLSFGGYKVVVGSFTTNQPNLAGGAISTFTITNLNNVSIFIPNIVKTNANYTYYFVTRSISSNVITYAVSQHNTGAAPFLSGDDCIVHYIAFGT